MASWTDNNRIPQFNPYVEQQPVSQMVQIGEQKQNQYDQGIQKIQGQIDNVAGMDVMRDTDKQYLQSRLNDLGNNLKTVAAADFSNFQLVNSTGGMINQIGKDPIIQNAVISTQRVRKGMAEKDTANQNGKGSPENDWWFNNGVNNYLNNTDPKASYNDSYLEYHDVKPKMMEVLKSLHESSSSTEVPWVTNIDGSVDYNKTATAMVENGYKGITSGKIENALRSSFDQNDLRQMRISGLYQFKNYSPDDLVAHAQNQYNQGIANGQAKIDALQKYIVVNKLNGNVLNEANAAIKELQQSIGEGGTYQSQLKNQLDNALQNIKRDPDSVKAELYKNGLVTEFANANSWDDTVRKYVTSPFTTQNNWERDFQLKKDQLTQSTAYQNALLELKTKAEEFKEGKKSGKTIVGSDFTTYLGHTQEKDNPQQAAITQIQSSNDRESAMEKTLAQHIKESIIRNGGDKNTIVTPNDIQLIVNNQYDGPLKSGITPELQDEISSVWQAKQQAALNQTAYDNAKDAVENSSIYKQALTESAIKLQSHAPLTISTNDGKSLTFSPQEIVNFLSKPYTISKTIGAESTSNFASYNSSAASLNRTPYEKIDLSSMSDKEQQLFNSGLRGKLNEEYLPFFQENHSLIDMHTKLLNDELLKRFPEFVPKSISVGDENDAIHKQYISKAAKILARGVNDHGGYVNWNPKTVDRWLTTESTEKDLHFNIIHTGNNVLFQIQHGKETQEATLNPEEAAQIPEAIKPEDDVVRERLIKLNGTTCVGNGDPRGSYWQNLPGIKKSQVVADVNQSTQDPNKVYPVIKVKTSEGWKSIIYGTGMPIENAVKLFASDQITDEYIKAKLKEQNPNFNGTIDTK